MKKELTSIDKITIGLSLTALIFAIPSIILSIWTYQQEYSENISIDVNVIETGYKTGIDTVKKNDNTTLKLFLAFECTLLNNSNRRTTLIDVDAVNISDNVMFYNPSDDINMVSRIQTPLSIDGRSFIKFYLFCPMTIEGKAKEIVIENLNKLKDEVELTEINELLYKSETDLMNNEVKNRGIYIKNDKIFQLTLTTSDGHKIQKDFGFYSRGR